MPKKLYVHVFETSRGPGGHIIGPKQFTRMMGKCDHGLSSHGDVDLYIVADKSIKSKEALECARFVCDLWDKKKRPTLVEMRESVQRYSRKQMLV